MWVNRVTVRAEDFPRRDCYPFDLGWLRERLELRFQSPITFFVGENGSGKSTLLEAIVLRADIPVWTSSKRHIAHRNPYENTLYEYVDLEWASGRVSGSFFNAETFRQRAFARVLHRYAAAGHAQFVIATHSPILLAVPGARLLALDRTGVRESAYEETEHYRLYRDFMADPLGALGLGDAAASAAGAPSIHPGAPGYMSRAVTVHASFPGGAAVASDQGFQDYAMERLGFFGDVTRRATRSACEQSG